MASSVAASSLSCVSSFAVRSASERKASASAPSIAIPLSGARAALPSFSGLRRSAALKQKNVSACKRVTKVAAAKGNGSALTTVNEAASGLPLVGNVAPDFEAEAVYDQEFIKVRLSDYQKQKKYVVLFFYPLDFTFVCPTEITAFSDRHSEFAAVNTEVLGVSVDSVYSHLAWIQTDRKAGGLGDLNYPLVADLTKEIAKAYNVLIGDVGAALRGLFIIDPQGVIQHATINNLAIGRSVDETLRTLQAVQYVQDNPDEVCPAGWKPGSATMKPDPKGSKDYFAAI
eukprot:TRINITY_DN17520_c0_g1_i1.p1 TRINITY_DN17520_c0_g1~~TRINITY_DN17520_c0_g1_i1.p1  ORF type:complete len:299 (+),score=64.93 TRINITY_DN17520_c0_g1_i1:40-897(+)